MVVGVITVVLNAEDAPLVHLNLHLHLQFPRAVEEESLPILDIPTGLIKWVIGPSSGRTFFIAEGFCF